MLKKKLHKFFDVSTNNFESSDFKPLSMPEKSTICKQIFFATQRPIKKVETPSKLGYLKHQRLTKFQGRNKSFQKKQLKVYKYLQEMEKCKHEELIKSLTNKYKSIQKAESEKTADRLANNANRDKQISERLRNNIYRKYGLLFPFS